MEIYGANLSFCRDYKTTFSLRSHCFKLAKENSIYIWTLHSNFLIVSANVNHNFISYKDICYEELLSFKNYFLINYFIGDTGYYPNQIHFLEKDLNKTIENCNIKLYIDNFLNNVTKNKKINFYDH